MPEPKGDVARSTEGTDSSLFSLSQIMHLMRVEFARSQRYGYPLACLLVSVDRLAELRDHYGYDAKEAILDEVVRILQESTRGCDYLGRLADDKLLAIIPHTPQDGLDILARRMLEGVRDLGFQAEGQDVDVSVSIGGSLSEGGRTMFFDTLLAAAEGALAESHHGGGGRYVHRDPGGDAS